MPTVKQQLVADIVGNFDFRLGSLRDLGSAGVNGTFGGTPYWKNSSKGRGLQMDGATDYVDVGNNAGEIKSITLTLKPDSITATTDYVIDLNGTDYITIVNGTVTVNGFATATTAVYTNGALGAVITDTSIVNHITITSDTAFTASDLDMGRLEGTGFFAGFFSGAILWTSELTAQQSSDLYDQWQLEAFLTSIPNKTTLPQPSADTDAFVLWSGELGQTGSMTDLTGNGNTAVATNFARASGVYPKAIDFLGVGTAQTSATLDLTDTDVLSIAFWMKKNSNSFITDIFESSLNYNSTAGTLRIGITATGGLTCAMRDGVPTGNYAGSESNSVPTVGKWCHYVVTFDRKAATGEKVMIYIDSVDDTVSTLTGFSTATNFGNQILYAAARGGTSLFGDIQMQDVRIYKSVISQTKINTVYNQGKKKLFYYQTGQDWNVSPANVTSGLLENSGWTINSGTWKVSDNGIYKVLECVANGQLQKNLVGASLFTTTTFETVSGTPTLTKNTNNLQIDALAGEKIGIISITP